MRQAQLPPAAIVQAQMNLEAACYWLSQAGIITADEYETIRHAPDRHTGRKAVAVLKDKTSHLAADYRRQNAAVHAHDAAALLASESPLLSIGASTACLTVLLRIEFESREELENLL